MKRLVILGRGAAGKSVLAAGLAQITGIPLTELDKVYLASCAPSTRTGRILALGSAISAPQYPRFAANHRRAWVFHRLHSPCQVADFLAQVSRKLQ